MYDAGKILIGLIFFLGLATFPIWFTLASGDYTLVPDPKPPVGEQTCVESKDYMKSWHMDLLDQWRDAVVRDGKRKYVSQEYGQEYEMSLTKECMRCHSNKKKFCDECHNYIGVSPYCWDCHIEPKGD